MNSKSEILQLLQARSSKHRFSSLANYYSARSPPIAFTARYVVKIRDLRMTTSRRSPLRFGHALETLCENFGS